MPINHRGKFLTPVSQSRNALAWQNHRHVTYVKNTCPPGLLDGAVQTTVACTLSLLSPCVIAAHSGRPLVLGASSHLPTQAPVATSLAWRKNPRNMSPVIVTGTDMLNALINVASLGNACCLVYNPTFYYLLKKEVYWISVSPGVSIRNSMR
jgi:hypothetical protein